MKLKYLILECGYDNKDDILEQEKKYNIRIIGLDKFEKSEIHHNSYYMILGLEEDLVIWIKECYTPDEDDQNEIIENLKDLEE